MYELRVDTSFSAAHCLKGYHGDCARLHGHTWGVSATFGAERLDSVGMGMDFKILSGELDSIVRRFDHENLNDLEEFREMNPTAEHLARLIFGRLSEKLSRTPVRVLSVTVAESDRYRVTYRGQDNEP